MTLPDSAATTASDVDVAVLVAMPDEATPFLERADTLSEEVHVGRAVQQRLTLAGRTVLLVRTGIGTANAAAAAAVVLSGDRPAALVSAGSAGGLGREVRVGDVVVGSRYLHAGADARAFGYALGQVPGMPADYTGDPALVAAAADAEGTGLVIRTGTMISGDAFVDAALVEGVRESFPDALSVDMETTALAQICFAFDVPFVSVRGISDLCGPVAGEDFLEHVDDAAERSARVVLALLAAVRPAG